MEPRSTGTRAQRRRRRESRRPVAFAVGAVAVCAAAVGIAALANGGGHDSSAAVATGTSVATVAPTAPPSAAPTVPPTEPPTVPPTQPDPGSLPQTEDKPTAGSPTFQAGVDALWQAIVTDDPSKAMPFFFPLGAYLQVKAISNPESDYRTRLVAAYEDDIHALHAKLGAAASSAQLAGIDVPDTAVWVQPGAEYNKGSYWRVYGAQLRYTSPQQSGAFPIASMISWRGEWYVVHLNSIR